eukprot:EG_transcript_24007
MESLWMWEPEVPRTRASLWTGTLAALVVAAMWWTTAGIGETTELHAVPATISTIPVTSAIGAVPPVGGSRPGTALPSSTRSLVSEQHALPLTKEADSQSPSGEAGPATLWWGWFAVTVFSFAMLAGYQLRRTLATGFGKDISPLMSPLTEVAMVSTTGEGARPDEKTLNKMRSFAEQYLKRSDTYLCVDKGVAAAVLTGLAVHKAELGSPLCPCRNYEDKQAEANQGYWNCPCVPMRERKECHCMLFLTKDNDFVGTERTISMEEITKYT